MTTKKIGLILCHEADLKLPELPRTVTWTYDLNSRVNNFGNRKFDYIADYDCHSYHASQFHDGPFNLLSDKGIYIQIDGLKPILELLNVSFDTYKQNSSVQQEVEMYIEQLSQNLGFSRFKLINQNIYYTGKYVAESEFSGPSDDILFEIAKRSTYTALINLCKTSKRVSALCKTPEFNKYFFKAWLREYWPPENALIQAYYHNKIPYMKSLFPFVNLDQLTNLIKQTPTYLKDHWLIVQIKNLIPDQKTADRFMIHILDSAIGSVVHSPSPLYLGAPIQLGTIF